LALAGLYQITNEVICHAVVTEVRTHVDVSITVADDRLFQRSNVTMSASTSCRCRVPKPSWAVGPKAAQDCAWLGLNR
jgi:hypothetical protein